MKKKYIKYFYFDTLIVDREFRNKNFSKKIINQGIFFSNKNNMPILLICKKRHIKFYQKFNFQLMNNANIASTKAPPESK